MNERVSEYAFVFNALRLCDPKAILDVGTGESALPALMHSTLFRRSNPVRVIAADNIKDYWGNCFKNRHCDVINDDIRATKLKEEFDLITCISTIEHIADWPSAIANMHKLLRTGGHLVLTCPYNEKMACPDIYKRPDVRFKSKRYICQQFSSKHLAKWLDIGLDIVLAERWCFNKGDFWRCGDEVRPPFLISNPTEPHQIGCFLLKKI